MPLNDIDPNSSSRISLSKASIYSGKSSHREDRHHGIHTSGGGNAMPQSTGVSSMLKTTTEIGDIDIFAKKSRLPPRPTPPRRPSHRDGSRASSQYSRSGSVRSKASSKHSHASQQMPGGWPGSSQNFSSSSVDLPLMSDSRSLKTYRSINSIATTSDRYTAEQRSYSLTAAHQPPLGFNNHPSLSNLKQNAYTTRPRSPYGYQTRLRRPYPRPASPGSQSDTITPPYSRQFQSRPLPGARAYTSSPLHHGSGMQAHYYEQQEDVVPMQTIRPASSLGSMPMAMQQHPFARPSMPNLQAAWLARRNRAVAANDHQVVGRTNAAPQAVADAIESAREVETPSAWTKAENQRVPTDTTPYVGFVQRVRQALEDRASMDNVRPWPSPHKLEKESETPKELPFAELPASPVVIKRLTRDMIKAAVGPPSETGNVSPEAPGSVISIAHGGDSSGDDSSLHARNSIEMPDSSSTPELHNSGSSITQEGDSSTDADDEASTHSPQAEHGLVDSSPDAKLVDNAQMQGADTSPKVLDGPANIAEILEEDPVVASLKEPVVQQSTRTLNFTKTRPSTQPPPNRDVGAMAPLSRQSLPTTVGGQTTISQVAIVEQRQITPTNGHEESNESREAVNQPDQRSTDSPAPVDDDLTCSDIGTSLLSSARVSMQSSVRPASAADSLHWATRSLIARKSFNNDQSERSSITTLVEPQQGPRVDVLGPSQVETLNAPTHEYPPRQSTATIERPSSLPSTYQAPVVESRLSAMRQFHFPLPDLTEDSQEDASTTNLRMLGSKPPAFRAGKRLRRETLAQTIPEGSEAPAAATASTQHPKSYLSIKLADTKTIPSLNFSHTDLTSKLNAALDLLSARSLEELKQPIVPNDSDAIKKKAKSPELAGRYRSFFPEAADLLEQPVDQQAEAEAEVERLRTSIAIVDELEDLSIPSVNGLTVRLSELLPSFNLGDLSFDPTKTKTKDVLGQMVDQICVLGSSDQTASLEHKRASLISALSAGAMAKSRREVTQTIRGRLSMDSIDEEFDKDLPLLPTEGRDPRPSLASGASVGTTQIPGSDAIGNSKRLADSTDNAPSDDDPTIEVSIPYGHREERERLAIDRPKFKLRKSRSLMDLPHNETEHIARSMSSGPHGDAELVPDGDLIQTKRGKKGVIGSIQRKVGLRKARAEPQIDAAFLHPEDRRASAGPGDRYPTTSLSPTHFNMDEARSYFSEDTSDGEDTHASALRKRLTRLKDRRSTQRAQKRVTSRMATRRDSHQSEERSHAVWMRDSHAWSRGSHETASSTRSVVLVYEHPPAGMSKMEFRMKRLVEKFRIFWSRGGEAVRSISRQGQARKHNQPGWYEASMYDGT